MVRLGTLFSSLMAGVIMDWKNAGVLVTTLLTKPFQGLIKKQSEKKEKNI